MLLHSEFDTEIHGGHKCQSQQIKLNLYQIPFKESGAREMSVYAPYWILNNTSISLLISHSKNKSHQVMVRPTNAQIDPIPAIFYSSKGFAYFAIEDTWSKRVNLNSVGLKVILLTYLLN